jgi:hypothetical protein
VHCNFSSTAVVRNWQISTCENFFYDTAIIDFRVGNIYVIDCFSFMKGRPGQLVSASSPSHQVLGSKPSLCRISAGVRLCFGYSFPQTPLVWEPLALGLPFIALVSCFVVRNML